MSPALNGTRMSLPVSMAKDDEQGMLGFFHTLERLKTNKRTGWVNNDVQLPESIADHMYRMSMMAMILPPPTNGEPPLDIARCVMMSLIHDLAEADVGDITPEHASGISREQKHLMEQAAMERIKGLLGHPSIASLRIEALWREYEDRETAEAKFVKDLDQFELAVQGVEYEQGKFGEESNSIYLAWIQSIQAFFETTVPRILHPTVKQWAEELMEQRRALWASRGWEGYVHVDVAPDTTSGSTTTTSASRAKISRHTEEKSAQPSFTQRVWGEHRSDSTAPDSSSQEVGAET
ncbi:BQ2448_704 [Microbotryum intermedium]|uniref:5'-deoxynucleotidase n=1 Tax=Microbotryum intermedium TaxID=269621 RepID=A0A238F992_9BASI|nr:BQ2448_704 [Microbotryum intermedium]